MRAALALLLWCAAATAGATVREEADCPNAPLSSWKETTEPGVSVRCGPSKNKRIPGDCAMLTVSPPGAKPWTAWANEDPPQSVRTLKRGELLVVGFGELRLFTRTTRNKDSRVGALPPTARLLSELSWDERSRLPLPRCPTTPILDDVSTDGEGHLLVKVLQFEHGIGTRKALAPVKLRVTIADGTIARVTPLPRAAPVPPPAPTPPPVAVEPEPPPAPDTRPADRPTAPTFGQRKVKAYKPKDSWWSCSSAPAGSALALAAVAAASARRRSIRGGRGPRSA
jgi:hypothetical protein